MTAAPSPGAPDRRGVARWRNAVIVAFALGGVAITSWGPRLPSLRADLGVDDGLLGVTLAGATVGALTGLGCSSAIRGRLGGRGAVRAALWVTAAGLAWVGIAAGALHALGPTMVGFLVVGFGIGLLDVTINVEGAAVEGAAGRTLMPLMHAAWSAGAVLGAGIGAGAAALGISPLWQFAAVGVVIAASAPLITAAFPAAEPASTSKGRRSLAERVGAWARGWTNLQLLAIGTVMLGVELGEGGAGNWLTLGARQYHGQTDAVAALFFVAFAASETTARLVAGPVVDRIGRIAAVRLTTALGVAGVLLFILGGPAWTALLGAVLWAIGVSLGFPLGMTAAAESGPDPAGQVSVVASIGYLANLAGPPLIGLLAQSYGLLRAFWVIAACLVLAFALAGSLRTSRAGASHPRGRPAH